MGVFATHDIRCGDVIGEYEGSVTVEDGTYVLWIVDEEDGSEVGVEGHNELRYLNHSPSPNCAFDGTVLSSLRDILAGDELTFHYGDDWA
jgi:SET domain-containing protein